MQKTTTFDELMVLRYQLLEIKKELNNLLTQLGTMKSQGVRRTLREARKNAKEIYKSIEELDAFVSTKKEMKALESAYNEYNKVIDLSFDIERNNITTPKKELPRNSSKQSTAKKPKAKSSPTTSQRTSSKQEESTLIEESQISTPPNKIPAESLTEDEIISDFASLLLAKEKIRNTFVDKIANRIAHNSSSKEDLENKIDKELSKKKYAFFKRLNGTLKEDMLLLAREKDIVLEYANLLSSKDAATISEYERKLIEKMKGKRFFDRLYYKSRSKTGIATRILVPGALIVGSTLTGGVLASAMLAAGSSLLIASRFISSYAGYQALHHAIQGRKVFRNDQYKLYYSLGINVMYNRIKAVNEKRLQKAIGKGTISNTQAIFISTNHLKAAKNMRRNRIAATLIAGALSFVGFARAYEHIKSFTSYIGKGLNSTYHFIMPDTWEHKISEMSLKLSEKASEVVSPVVERAREIIQPVVEKTKDITQPIVEKTKHVLGVDIHHSNGKPHLVSDNSKLNQVTRAQSPAHSVVLEPTSHVKNIEVVVWKGEGVSHTAYKAIDQYFSKSQDDLQSIAQKLGTTKDAIKNALMEELTKKKIKMLGRSMVHPGEKLVYTNVEIKEALKQISESHLKELKDSWKDFVHHFGMKHDGAINLEKFKPKLKR